MHLTQGQSGSGLGEGLATRHGLLGYLPFPAIKLTGSRLGEELHNAVHSYPGTPKERDDLCLMQLVGRVVAIAG